VEGHFVGQLDGLSFQVARGSTSLEERALRGAAQRAVAPEIARRLGRLTAEADDAFALTPEGVVLWRGEAAAALTSDRPFAPRVRLYGELGSPAARERAARRLEAFLAAEAGRRLPGLKRLEDAVASGALKGLPRGLAYRLIEAGGVLPRAGVEMELKSLSRVERRALRSLGVRLAEFALFLPELMGEGRAFGRAFALAATPDWRPLDSGVVALPSPMPQARALGLRGLAQVGAVAAPVEQLERLDELLRGAARQGNGVLFSDQAREELGWSEPEARAILRGLGFAPVGRGPTQVWRRRSESPPRRQPPIEAHASPFAALAHLKPSAPRRKRRPRRAHA
jgi:ATP-dependent RNA helicase SUPV3L1/SUV3